MVATPTRSDLFDAGRRAITVRPSRIPREIVDTPGSTARLLVGAGATMAEEVAVFSASAFNELRLATAAKVGGDVLDRAVFDRFGRDIEPRRTASVARTYARFYRPVAGEGVTIPAGTKIGTADGITFTTAVDGVLGPTETGPIVVLVLCDVAGVDGNVAANTITRVLTRLDDTTILVTNGEAASGGEPAETDEAYFARAQRYWAGARRGTPSAVKLGAESVQGVSDALVTEVLDPINFEPTMRARVVIAGSDGYANLALADLVREELEEYRPLGVPVAVIGGQPIEISIVITGVVFVAGANTASVKDQMRQAIAVAVNELGPGETLYRARIFAALQTFANVAKVPESGLIEPAGDLAAPTVQSVITTRASLVSIS